MCLEALESGFDARDVHTLEAARQHGGSVVPNRQAASSSESGPPITFNARDSSVVETSWAYDRLDIYNKKFQEIRADLERRYQQRVYL